MQLTAGTKIGTYSLLERIGQSNMGDVWRAAPETDPNYSVAIKCLNARHESNPAMHHRFEMECIVHRSFRHSGIVMATDVFHYARQLFLVMPYIAGGSLEDRLRQGPLPQSSALPIAIQVLDALDHVNQSGIVHRDVKPSNILCNGHQVFLTDFGIAHPLLHNPAQQVDTSGTIAYMSPEQIQSPHTVDQRSDVYGFGCVLYEMLTGRPPFPLDANEPCTDDQIKIMHVTRQAIPPGAFCPGLDPRLEQIVMRALNKQPAARFAGCGSFALALRALTHQGPAPVMRNKNNRWAIAAGVAVVLAILAAAIS
jgi:serine/threonine-protein kinase